MRKYPAAPPKKAAAVSHPRLAWNSGTRLEAATYRVTPAERASPCRAREATCSVNRTPSTVAAPRTTAPPTARERLCPPATITLAMVTPSGSLCSRTARNSRIPSRSETRNPLAMATPSKKVCSVRPKQGRGAGRRAQVVGLLSKVKVGREHVLSQVHREVARQHEER